MAKNTVNATKKKPLKDWAQVEAAVAAMNAASHKAAAFKAERQPEIDKLIQQLNDELGKLEEEYRAQEQLIVNFVSAHMDELGDSKTRNYTLGSVSARRSAKVTIQDDDKAVEMLRKLGHDECIKASFKPIKTALKGLSESDLALIGAEVTEATKVRVKPLTTFWEPLT